MAEKKRSSYTPEFRKKATDLALTSGHPTSYVAQLLKIKESTLGNWVAKAKKVDTRAKKSALKSVEKPAIQKEKQPVKTEPSQLSCNSTESEKRGSGQQKNGTTTIQTVMGLSEGNDNSPSSKTNELFPGISENLPLELQKLRSENQKLKRERNIFREAIILLASQDCNICS